MRAALSERAARRAELLARTQGDRRRIARDLQPLAGALALIDRGWAGVQWVRERPLLVAAAVAAGTALSIYRRRRGGALKLLRLGLSAWQSWRLAARALSASRQRNKP